MTPDAQQPEYCRNKEFCVVPWYTPYACPSLNCEAKPCKHDTRTRQHTPAPEINPVEKDSRGYRCLHMEVRNDVGFCHYMNTKIVTLPVHDATVARAATLAAYDKFMEAVEFRFDDTNNGRGIVGVIREIKDKLRRQVSRNEIHM